MRGKTSAVYPVPCNPPHSSCKASTVRILCASVIRRHQETVRLLCTGGKNEVDLSAFKKNKGKKQKGKGKK